MYHSRIMTDTPQWIWHAEDGGYFEYKLGAACVTLQRRPVYCDRGHWMGKVFGIDDIDEADSFPRYYMDETRAKDEMREWLHWRLKA